MKFSMKRKTLTAVILFIMALALSCAGRDYREVMKEPEKLFYDGQYKEAARMLLPEVNTSGKDQILFMMECGYMLHMAKDYDNSNKVLLMAAKETEVKPISISKQVASLLSNERATNYRGEDYEKVLIHMYLGINFLLQKNYDSARVEFKAVNEQLSRIKKEDGSAKYKQNIMAKYLTAVAYEIIGEQDSSEEDLEFAYIEYKQLLELDPALALTKRDLQRVAKKLDYMDEYDQWVQRFGRLDTQPKDAGEVIMIFQTGRTAIKESRGKLLKDPMMHRYIVITLNSRAAAAGVTIAAVLGTMSKAENPIPKLTPRTDRLSHVNMVVNGKMHRTWEMENISETAVNTMKDNYPRLAKKVAASIALKAIASVAAGAAAKGITEKASGSGMFGSLMGLVAGVGTGAALFSSMKPDLRCWHTLPARLQLGRIFLKPGEYTLTLEYVAKDGEVSFQEEVPVKIEKDRKVFINRRSLF